MDFSTMLFVAIGFVFFVVDCTPLANLLAMPLWRVSSSTAKADVAVVLAGGHFTDGTLNRASTERTIAAVRLYQQGRAPYLLFSGGPCCGHAAGALMAALAHDLGVPRSAILLEEQSTRTHDGAVRAAEIIRRQGFRSVILVTSPIHLTRARLVFIAAGVPVHPVRASERDLWLIVDTDERIALLGDAIHEYLGLAFYHLKGWNLRRDLTAEGRTGASTDSSK